MKMVHISLYPPKGEKHAGFSGVASYTKNLIMAMPRQKNDQVYILCDMINGKFEEYEEDGAIVVRCFSRTPNFVMQTMQELKKINPDVLHIQQELALYGNVVTAYLLQWLVFFCRKYSPVITLHGVVNPHLVNKEFVRENNSHLPPWLVRIAFYVLYKPLTVWAKKIIVHEQIFKNILAHKYHVPAQKTAVIPHGVETLRTKPKDAACKKLGLNPMHDLVLFMGFATGYKGLELLIEGFGSYAKANPNAFLVIGAGKHPKLKNDPGYLQEYKRLQQKAEQLIPATQYEWRGFIPENEIRDYYSACDVSIYPYTTAMSSSGPMSFAIGFEKPFLASTAFAEVFDSTLLFERSPVKLAEKLAGFFSGIDTYSAISKQLKEQRTWHKIAEKTYEIYEEAT